MKQTFIRISESLKCVKIILFIFEKAYNPVSCSKQQITNRYAEPQEHSSHSINKSDLLIINVTEAKPVI